MLALIQGDFVAEMPRPRAATDAGDAKHAIEDLDPQHP